MRLEAVLGDITEERVDAIVNAANSSISPPIGSSMPSRRAGARRRGRCHHRLVPGDLDRHVTHRHLPAQRRRVTVG
jgi:hypothetical protein